VTLNYLVLNKKGKNAPTITFAHNFLSHYVWKFNEIVPMDLNIVNINSIFESLECLK